MWLKPYDADKAYAIHRRQWRISSTLGDTNGATGDADQGS